MLRSIGKSLWLLLFTIVICCILYPAILWAIGQTFFPFKANGSMLTGPDGSLVGSRMIAQPFTKDEYFWPRPSAASFDGSASTSSALAPSNPALRNRVATLLGPIVKYKSGPKAGQLVAPDIEAWFQQDHYQGAPHIVAQWADMHNAMAQAWVTADPTHAAYVDAWSKSHSAVVQQWIASNPATPQPAATDLAIVFFEHFSNDNPGKFPSSVTTTGPDGKPQTSVQPVNTGTDIQSNFFDMWRLDHADADLEDVPGDFVTSSGSGLDPDITMENAEFQLPRVANKWAVDLKRNPTAVHDEIEALLESKSHAPLDGLAGEKLVNTMDVNLALREQYGAPQ